MMKQVAQKGFTLIELMIVVVIAAILGAVAYPSYQEHVRKTRRAEAKSALMQVMMQQERYYTQNNAYRAFAQATPNGFKTHSGDNAASSAYVISGAACGAGLAECVQLTATVNTASGFSDTRCASLSLTSAGARSATGTGSTEECWR